MTTKKDNIIEPLQVNIFGSCVTRDIFALDDRKLFTVGEYIARQSVISFLSKPVAFDDTDIKLSSAFQRKQIVSDLSKNGFSRLKSNLGDYLVIDMIEERFKVGKISNSYFTDSNELDASGFLERNNAKLYERHELNGKVFFRCCDMSGYISKFAHKISELYEQRQIVIHEVYLTTYFIDKDGQVRRFPKNYVQYAQKLNRKLEYMYKCLKRDIPKAQVISISNRFIADENHKWGLAPMHFREEYYREALDELYRIIF